MKCLLITSTLKGKVLEERLFTRDRIIFGRDGECDVVLDASNISRHHAEVVKRGDDFVLRDLGSANGTLVNRERIVEHVLTDHDTIQIGAHLIHTRVVTHAENDDNEVVSFPWQRDETIRTGE